ncbi:unnamed protein product [Phyllotreta striolata]|uniref:SLC41A/MgtE integral membrane domain-containing protein n=1 Tax=Phyllotreta striolata TaxID=444603 RepID=A0A9N9TN86_PHYSR|nr:unnamed protein product [Phyllotreta striolata]
MGITTNNDKKSSLREDEDRRVVVVDDAIVIHENNRVRTSKLSTPKTSLSEPGSKRSSLGVYSIGGFSVESQIRRDAARKSIVSIRSEKQKLDEEKWYQIITQVSVPFFIAGIGTIGAGIVLSKVTEFKVFKKVQALLVLIPALLGLKGNLDMCLASRLSTQANLGKFEDKRELFKIIYGNVLLVQIQAIVASCVVSVFAVSASAMLNGHFEWLHTLLLITSSILTATLSCFTLDLVLVSIIVLSHKIKVNPDNIATPMAASIGDVVSLITLSLWARLLFSIHEKHTWVMFAILGFYIFGLLPIWVLIVRRNAYTKTVLLNGWVPVISALFISGMGGIVLQTAVGKFAGYAVFQPIVNGIGGNLVSIQASRISTMLHKTSLEGVIPLHTKQWATPYEALISGVLPAKSARLLLALSIPGHIVFVFAADLINSKGGVTVNVFFVLIYILVGSIQLVILLYVCHILVHTMWRFRIDPDNSSIPYLTALGDLLGSTLLLAGFVFLESVGHEYKKKHTHGL